MKQPLDFIRLRQFHPIDPEGLSRKANRFSRGATSSLGREGESLHRGIGREKGREKRGLQHEVLISFPDQRLGLVPRSSTENSKHDHQDPHLLSGNDPFPQILIPTQQEYRSSGSLTGQGHQISHNQRIDPLLLVADETPKPKLYVRQLSDREMLLGRYGVWGGVVPVDSKDRKPAMIRGELDQCAGQRGIVTSETLSRRSTTAQLAPSAKRCPASTKMAHRSIDPSKEKGPLAGLAI